MITVHVRLFATLRNHRTGLKLGESFPLSLPEDATVLNLLQQAGIPENEAKLVFVNGLVRALDHTLVEGDELGIFPPVGGG